MTTSLAAGAPRIDVVVAVPTPTVRMPTVRTTPRRTWRLPAPTPSPTARPLAAMTSSRSACRPRWWRSSPGAVSRHPSPSRPPRCPTRSFAETCSVARRTGSGKTSLALPTVLRLAAPPSRRQPGRPGHWCSSPPASSRTRCSRPPPIADALGLRTTTVYGGVGQQPQVRALQAGVDVVIACPGRLDDLIGQRHCSLGSVEITVLDEADHMADLGFLPVVRRLLDATPPTGQRLLFSATLDRGVDVLVQRYLSEPVTHSVDPEVAPVASMTHHVFAVALADKPAVVHELAGGRERSLLFTRTCHGEEAREAAHRRGHPRRRTARRPVAERP
ncbi:MAG: DEAD/DEAH box helicase [Ilumatobacteraceae bacterium]